MTDTTAGRTATGAGAHDGGRLPGGFTEERVRVGDLTMNHVRGGSGKTLVLLHGYPQTWFMWRRVLPVFARHHTVIAPDLRGAGDSDAPRDGYDKKTLAADVHGLLTSLGLNRDIHLVGHDIGAMVAYAYAAAHPGEVAKLVLTEAPIPDQTLYQFPSLTPQGPGFWNFGFFTVPNGLPEQIVTGREELWVDGFIDSLALQKTSIGTAAVREYARHLTDPAHLRASFEYFRTLHQDIADNTEYSRTNLPMPVLAIGARGSLAKSVPNQVARYATDVTGEVIENSGHWIFEEQPEQLADRLLRFFQ